MASDEMLLESTSGSVAEIPVDVSDDEILATPRELRQANKQLRDQIRTLNGKCEAYRDTIKDLREGLTSSALTPVPPASVPPTDFATRARLLFETDKTGLDKMSGDLLFEGDLHLEAEDYPCVKTWYENNWSEGDGDAKAGEGMAGDENEQGQKKEKGKKGTYRLRQGINETHTYLQKTDGQCVDGQAVIDVLNMAQDAF
ncbi:hypothetical protein CONPUDRAFT_170424, partial [Coniophora puteana RWD-64-598 SS2]